MSRSFRYVTGFMVTAVVGTLLHFLYDLSGQQPIIGWFSAVNESIWEHMKLLFFPMLAVAVVQWFLSGREQENYWCVTAVSIIAGTLLIPALYYTYSGAFGVNSDYVNITIFFAVAAVSYWLQSFLFRRGMLSCKHSAAAIVVLLSIAVLFWVFTYYAPSIPLFEDPLNSQNFS